ncbi:hypothetical protein ACHWQZ_G015966 [Mnemiopsis leidyi]
MNKFPVERQYSTGIGLLNQSSRPYSRQDQKKPLEWKKPPVKVDDVDPNIACPPCSCPNASNDGAPSYCHLGYGSSYENLRATLESRYDLRGPALRLVEIQYTGKEAKSKEGCPVVQSVIQRTSLQEQVCVLYRHRSGHSCESALIVVVIVQWEGLPAETASDVYATLAATLPSDGVPTQRQCDKNQTKTCMCQGSEETGGACFSFGCSWSMYFNGCKFANSRNPKKFKLDEKSKTYDARKEEQVECIMQALATDVGALYKTLAPKAYFNQVRTQEDGWECRIGSGRDRPFSGITACLDFSAHNHKDKHNLSSGVTVVVTLLKHKSRIDTSPYRDQIHSLPMYTLAQNQGDYHAMQYSPEIFADINVPAPQPVPPQMFQRHTQSGVEFDEAGYVQYLRQQEMEYRAQVDGAIRSLGPPRHFMCGGVGIVPTHGSVILEHALRELHVTTPLPQPYRYHPTRIALVLYQHKNLNLRSHGYKENEEKMRQKSEGKEEKPCSERRMGKEERSADKKQNKDHFPSYDKGLKEQMNCTEMKEQINAAKLRREKENSMSIQIAPLNPLPRYVPVDCQSTRGVTTVSTSQSLPHMYTAGSFQHVQTCASCEKCCDMHCSRFKVTECKKSSEQDPAANSKGNPSKAKSRKKEKSSTTKRSRKLPPELRSLKSAPKSKQTPGAGSAPLQLTIPTFKPDSDVGPNLHPPPDSALQTSSYNHQTFDHVPPHEPHVTSFYGMMPPQGPHMMPQMPNMASPHGYMTSPNLADPFQHLPPLKNQQIPQNNNQILNAQGYT